MTPRDLVDTTTGKRIRVREGKGDKFRETPVPETLAAQINAAGQFRDEPDSEPVVQVSKRQVTRYLKRAAEKCQERDGKEGLEYISTHDLRRSWAQQLLERDVEPGMIMDWGGWENWDTFREHYMGRYSPQAQQRQQENVPWL